MSKQMNYPAHANRMDEVSDVATLPVALCLEQEVELSSSASKEARSKPLAQVIAVAKAIRTNVSKPIAKPSFGNVLTVVAVAIRCSEQH